MADVVIKGEIHTSRGDYDEERELLAEGVDALVVEGQRNGVEYGWLDAWLGWATWIFDHLFASMVFSNHQNLVDIAEGQRADVIYTRDSNTDLLDNSHTAVVWFAMASFYLWLLAAAVAGYRGSHAAGALSLLGAGLTPLLVLRTYETYKREGNRDEIIANKIAAAAEEHERVVSVLGARHAAKVPDHLPAGIDPEILEPRYRFLSARMARDLVAPGVKMWGTLTTVYPVYLAVVKLSLVVGGRL